TECRSTTYPLGFTITPALRYASRHSAGSDTPQSAHASTAADASQPARPPRSPETAACRRNSRPDAIGGDLGSWGGAFFEQGRGAAAVGLTGRRANAGRPVPGELPAPHRRGPTLDRPGGVPALGRRRVGELLPSVVLHHPVNA